MTSLIMPTSDRASLHERVYPPLSIRMVCRAR